MAVCPRGGVPHDVERAIHTQSIGVLARRVVRQPGFEGRILACLREAVYFRGSGAQLMWLALPNHLPHRRAILARFDPSAAAVGSSVRTSDGCLVLDGLPAIPISEAPCWSPPPLDRRRLLAWDALCDRLQAHVAQVIESPDRRGFGHFIGLPLGDLPGADSGDPDIRRWEAIFPPARDLILAGQTEGLDGVFDPALKLIGLGPGLTPAGDDFVGGLLFALQQLGRAYPGRVHRDLACRNAFLERARRATSRISYVILCDLAHGHGPEPMHALLWALLHGEEPVRAMSATQAITRIGHTSGWDMLAGVLTGMSLLVAHDGR
jgi:hypothetical protein